MKWFREITWSIILLTSLAVAPRHLVAQNSQQVWFDFQLDHPFANQYLFETTASYQTIINDANQWKSFSLTPVFEWQGFRRFDFITSMPMVYSLQKEGVNSFEVDPAVGARFHITQNKRVDTRLIAKIEERFYRQIEQGNWETSNRIRLKGEAWISINGPNLYTDKLWYAILDFEFFFATDQQLNERFAVLRRGRLGAGYRLNYNHRFEIIYTSQASRNEIGANFESGDNVIQLRYKFFIIQATPTPVNP